MKKKKEVIIIISAILFAIALFVKMNQTLQLILMLVAYILLGKDTVLKAVKNVEKGDFFDENFLMTIATLGAIIIGEYPEAVAVMLFYEIGELFQSYAINKSRKSIADMMDIKPEYANVIRDNKSQKVDPDEVKIDEIIEAYRQKYSIDKDDDRINKKTFDEKVDNIKIEETEDLFGNTIEEARENKDEIFGNSTDETIIVNTLEDLDKVNTSSDQEKSENPDKTIYVQTIEQGIENNRNNIEEENDIKEDNPNVEEVYNIENIIEEKTSGLSQNTDVIDTAEINKKLEEENELKFDEMYQKAFGAEVSEKRKERLKNEEKIDRNINSKTCKK